MANSYVGGKVEYILDANDTALRAGLSSAKNKMDEFGNAAQATASRTSATFGGLGSTITKVVAAFALEETARKFLTFGIASATALQTTSTSMQLLTGNTAQANAVLGTLYKFSQGT